MTRRDVTLGLFVGGQSRRMGSPKGLLEKDGERLVERGLRLGVELGLPVRLVGRRAEYADYAGLVTEVLEDEPPGIGPLGGLAALLRSASTKRAIAMAVDMPYVTAADLEALIGTREAIAAPKREGRWEPLFAIYDRAAVLPIIRRRIDAKQHSLQGLLEEAGAVTVALPSHHLDDWDAPEDIGAGGRRT